MGRATALVLVQLVADEPPEIEQAYQYVLAGPRFRFGARLSGPLALDVKRFSGKRLLE